MSTPDRKPQPEVGSWYRDPVERRFEVMAVDQESGTIDIRYDDGETAQMTVSDWRHAMLDRDASLDESVSSPDMEDDDRR